MNTKTIHLLFAATSDFLPYATLTAVSVKDNIKDINTKLCIHFMYADIVKPISDSERNNIFEAAKYTFEKNDIEFEIYNVEEYIPMFEGQNVGMWGKEISFTHYMYLLAPIILKNIEKVIYLDTDMVVNCDLSEVYNIDLSRKLIAMGSPRGMEEMGDDVSNSGFSVINLNQWRTENTLEILLNFGKILPRERFCDQNLLYQYFTKNNPDRLLLVDKEYNIFPQVFESINLDNIKILHFTGFKSIKPWIDINSKQRAGFLWWEYARKTAFYERFLFNAINYAIDIKKEIKPKKLSLKEIIFSLTNQQNHKVITILGLKIKLKRRNKCQK